MTLPFFKSTLAAFTLCLTAASARTPMLVYIGTFNPGPPHHGIYSARFDVDSGVLSDPKLQVKMGDPSFLTLSRDGKVLFSSGLIPQPTWPPLGTLSSFTVNRETGDLTPLSQKTNGTEAACHIALSADGRTLFAANYMNGFAASYAVSEAGALGEPLSLHKHAGSSVNKSRQEGPHVHGVTLSPDGHFLFAPDLGADKIVAYKVSAEGVLTPYPEANITSPAGHGPRHVQFSIDGRHLYEIDEMVAVLRVHRYDATTGRTEFLQEISLVPADFKGGQSGAEIALHPNGRWLYASNREEHQSVAVFAIEGDTGLLAPVQHWQPGLNHPRHITVDPTGRWLIVTNTFGDTVVSAPIDPASGRLGDIVSKIQVPRASCVVFVP